MVPSPAPITNWRSLFGQISRSRTPFIYFSQSFPGGFFGLWRPKHPINVGLLNSFARQFKCNFTTSPLIVPANMTESSALICIAVKLRRILPRLAFNTCNLRVVMSMRHMRKCSAPTTKKMKEQFRNKTGNLIASHLFRRLTFTTC